MLFRSLRMQALMLRFLETGEIQRVGSDGRTPVLDVRVITATHRQLLDRVADGTFREDLYYRLNVIHIQVPPLRARTDDIAPLVGHFLVECAATNRVDVPVISAEALARLTQYSWPGNVRELKNIVERMMLRCRNGLIDVGDLPAEVLSVSRTVAVTAPGGQPTVPPPVALFERVARGGESFWSVVYEPFMSRDLTREDLRAFIQLGLEQSRGSYRGLVAILNLPPEDYKRFLSILRKYQCHLPFQRFRAAQVGPDREFEADAERVTSRAGSRP